MTEQHNASDISVPPWLEAKLFENILKEMFDNYKNIKEFAVKPALATGENCATVVWRIEIEVESEDSLSRSISFILKLQHNGEQFGDILNSHDTFDIEKGVYDQIIPEFEKLYNDVGLPVKFGAKSYRLPLKKRHILLENLGLRGFKNINRLEGLDREHTKCALKKLAQWHAASAVCVASRGPFEQKYTEGYFRKGSQRSLQTMFDELNQIFLSFAKTYNNYKDYADDIHSARATMTDELFRAAKPEPSEFNVLNHGDCWSNNIMFQYDAFGKIKETYFVDYQVPKYGTPAQDLYYMILSSTKYDIKVNEFDYFIKFYHDQLVENLKTLRYTKKSPTLSELHAMLYKYGIWGYSTAVGVMAAALMGPTNAVATENCTGNVESSLTLKTLIYSNDRYRQHAELVLPWLKNRGAFSF